jgi:anthranilate synthase/aminodeoxychorismate synthase-like glutamine amidotransferase
MRQNSAFEIEAGSDDLGGAAERCALLWAGAGVKRFATRRKENAACFMICRMSRLDTGDLTVILLLHAMRQCLAIFHLCNAGADLILLLDNHDSFVYNLARYVDELGLESVVRLSDSLQVADVIDLAPSHIILSPGPCTPSEAGICTDVVRSVGGRIPILGVCLGHQCIGEVFGARIVPAKRPMHGKAAPVYHEGHGVLAGIPTPFSAARYHSLVVEPESCPDTLQVTARSAEGEIMAFEHDKYRIAGVQFHPESVATEWGYRILANFLGVSDPGRVTVSADSGRSASALIPEKSGAE